MSHALPRLAILGAGPIGLETALAAAQAGFPFTLYEAGDRVGAHIHDWNHVRLFSPWDLDVSPRARARLRQAGQEPPDGNRCPTGAELVARLLDPLAALPEIAPHLRLGARVVAVGREGLTKSDEIGTGERAHRAFRLLVAEEAGRQRVEWAAAVVDCTGSYSQPNALGDGGIPCPGEAEMSAAGLVERRIPDLSRDGNRFMGRTVLLVGSGHSAQTAVRDLAALAAAHPRTRVVWVLRREEPTFGQVADDPLRERAELIAAARALAGGSSPAVATRRGRVVEALGREGGAVVVTLRRRDGATEEVRADRVLALTGTVGDHQLYRQLQIHECYATSGPMKLAAALLGEASADCLAQQSHGADTLRNPEPGFFILGAKSYGRNPTFLMRVGWQQVDEILGLLAAGAGRPEQQFAS